MFLIYTYLKLKYLDKIKFFIESILNLKKLFPKITSLSQNIYFMIKKIILIKKTQTDKITKFFFEILNSLSQQVFIQMSEFYFIKK